MGVFYQNKLQGRIQVFLSGKMLIVSHREKELYVFISNTIRQCTMFRIVLDTKQACYVLFIFIINVILTDPCRSGKGFTVSNRNPL